MIIEESQIVEIELPDGFEELLMEYVGFPIENEKTMLAKPLSSEFFLKCYERWGEDEEIWESILEYFHIWVWLDWCEKNLPHADVEVEVKQEKTEDKYTKLMNSIDTKTKPS